MTYTWLGINMGQVLSVGFLGPVVAALGPRAPYCVAAPLEPWFPYGQLLGVEVLAVLWPALGNFMGERPAQGHGPVLFQPLGVKRQALVLLSGWPRHPVLCRLTLLIGALALFLVAARWHCAWRFAM